MRALLLGGGLVVLAVALLAPLAAAGGLDPCTATIGGQTVVPGTPIEIQPGQKVEYSFAAPGPVKSYSMQLHYGPVAAAPSSGEVDSDETTVSGSIDMDKYAWMGVGLYTLEGSVLLVDGRTCAGSIDVDVQGNPLTTAVGATAAVIAGGSTIGLVALFLKAGGFLAGA